MRTKFLKVLSQNRRASLLLMVLAVLFLCGCQSLSALDACKNDPECAAQMEQVRESSATSAALAVSTNKNIAPVATTVGSVVGLIMSYGFGVLKGKKIKKG